jgi:hypothetical protein
MTRGREPAPWRYVVLALWVVMVDAWFQGPLTGRWTGPRAAIPAALALGAVAAIGGGLRRRDSRRVEADRRRLVLAVAGVALVATLVRLPALAAPASLISSDSAVAGIIAQEIAAGQLPAPIYAPGFPYEGTLKPHLTVLVSWLLPGGIPSAYAWTSHLFHLLWTAVVMVLARDAAGMKAAVAAGLFMAVSPRFLVAFSLNNVGQYPEVNALGALALLALGRGAALLAGFLLGLAVWQQLLAVYFVAAGAALAAMTPALRRPGALARLAGGAFAGSYPMWVWNAANGWATFDLLRRGGKEPADRVSGLPDAFERMATASFPKLFGLTDLGAGPAIAVALGLAMPLLVVAMAWARRADIRERRGRSPAAVAIVLLVVVVAMFAASKFSHRGAQRPRYLMPVYTSTAVAFGWAIAALARRSGAAAVAAAAVVLGANLAGLVPWLQGRAGAEARDRALLAELDRLGVRTGYAGFWVAPKFTFLSEGRLTLSGELGPVVSWVHAGHAARVREAGPDALIVGGGSQGDALSSHLAARGCAHKVTKVSGLAVFHGFGCRISLEDVAGYDVTARPADPGDAPDVDP